MNSLLHGLTRLASALLALTIGGPCFAEPEVVPTPPRAAEAAAATEASTAPAANAPVPAVETPAAACASQHEAAQVERMDGHLLEARDALLACSHEECPSVVRTDCVTWLEEVRAQIPTVVFEALGDEGLVTDVTVKLGDRTIASGLDGKPVEVPVGLCEFTFERGTGQQKTLRVLLRHGETNRIVSADFRSAQSPTVAVEPPPQPPQMVAARPIPNSVLLFGTATLLATAAGITFGTVAKIKEGEAGGTCAPDCADGVLAEIKDFALAADISFGVAIAAGLTTTILYLGRPTVMVPRERTATLTPRLLASPGIAWLGVQGRFQ